MGRSLAQELGLAGVGDPEHFHRIRGWSPRGPGAARFGYAFGIRCRSGRRARHGPGRVVAGGVDQYVRRLLAEGERYQTRLLDAAADDGEVLLELTAYLTGRRQALGIVGLLALERRCVVDQTRRRGPGLF